MKVYRSKILIVLININKFIFIEFGVDRDCIVLDLDVQFWDPLNCF